MAHYLVTARPLTNVPDLAEMLRRGALLKLRPFGKAITRSLTGARVMEDGTAVWEEEDYCVPPLAQERAAVLDRFFEGLSVEAVRPGDGWSRIESLPPLFPELSKPPK
jgi:hypothetical protein